MPQIRHPRSFSPAQQAIGVRLLLRGFIYKAAIADTLARIADPVFAHVDQYEAHALLTATIAFYGQIYFDFAGYSSMAIGTARLFGYRFPPNFNYPYRAASVTEFWRRWHMSLSFWLRDYLYIPLGGNRGGTLFVCRNLMITMLLGGLWHGAAWNYVVWGALHGVGLCANKLWSEVWRRLPVPIDVHGGWYVAALVLTQLWVMLAWVFFRCDSAAQATEVLAAILGLRPHPGAAVLPVKGCILAVMGLITRLGALASGCRCRPDGPGRSRGAGSEPCSPSGSRRCQLCRNRSSTSNSEAVDPPPPPDHAGQGLALLDVPQAFHRHPAD
jgi:alginate O-acetyltransferase complex protein AlgI